MSRRLLKFRDSEKNSSRYLAGVLASLEESSTEHVGGNLTRVGGLAAGVAQDGDIQAHQTIRVLVCRPQ